MDRSYTITNCPFCGTELSYECIEFDDETFCRCYNCGETKREEK